MGVGGGGSKQAARDDMWRNEGEKREGSWDTKGFQKDVEE